MAKTVDITPEIRGTVVHETWEDAHFTRFGIQVASEEEPLVSEQVVHMLSDETAKAIGRVIHRYGFIDVAVSPSFRMDMLPKNRRLASVSYAPGVNPSLPHIDNEYRGYFSALYRPRGSRVKECMTAVMGRTSAIREMILNMHILTKQSGISRKRSKRIEDFFLILFQKIYTGQEYGDDTRPYGTFNILSNLNREIHGDPALRNRPFFQFQREVIHSLHEQGLVHLFDWPACRLRFISSKALHALYAPRFSTWNEQNPLRWRGWYGKNTIPK